MALTKKEYRISSLTCKTSYLFLRSILLLILIARHPLSLVQVGLCIFSRAFLLCFCCAVTQHQVVLLSRYRDNICIMNAKKYQLAVFKQLRSLLLHQIYGIKLKWETRTEDVVWGEGVLRGDGTVRQC